MVEIKLFDIPCWHKAERWYREDGPGFLLWLQKNAGIIDLSTYCKKFEEEFHCKLVWQPTNDTATATLTNNGGFTAGTYPKLIVEPRGMMPYSVIFESAEWYNWFLLKWA